MDIADPVNLEAALASFSETYSPRIVTRVNDYDVRIAHTLGDHVWHVHDDTDEFFLVLEGELLIDFEDRDSVLLRPHQAFTVPKGVVHRTRAPTRTAILMVEAAGVAPTGD
jgi:mannose-6-phosphate isomerase-like protein (cupin superfamily)